ncbi:MAG: FAD-dependent oxidoreductase [Myxococcaceae bacterium]|nr:FAD-dependent oxidoreductase [Myxococcaceae bacterium]
MALRINNIGLWLDEPDTLLQKKAAEKLRVAPAALKSVRVVRSVLDARKKNSPRYIYTLEVEVEDEARLEQLPPDVSPVDAPPLPAPLVTRQPATKPIIIGTGPAGLFCALALLERGVKSVVLERGRDVIERRKEVAKLMRDGTLNPESNMNFGEGGAGAYTDGKLSTRINHPHVRKVIETFARYGAPGQILIDGKPHIGSDLLPLSVEKLRLDLIAQGVEVHFNARVDELLYRDGHIAGVKLADGTSLHSDRVVLAPGNSARELFERLASEGKVFVEAKPFALGFRAEHPQAMINAIQYGERVATNARLPPADYKLADNFEVDGDMRGVYSFCMCPGGIVVPTPTEEGFQCTNGMSNSRRNSKYANAGIVVSVSVDDFAREGFSGPLAGVNFQRHWEKKAYQLGGGKYWAPAQSIPDYLAGKLTQKPGGTTYRPGLAHADLNQLFPKGLTLALHQALKSFSRKMKGFTSGEGWLIGIESRTSTPLRVTRNETLQSVSMKGLYPAGEGCGYAGGIVSSGIDGLRVAEQICNELS